MVTDHGDKPHHTASVTGVTTVTGKLNTLSIFSREPLLILVAIAVKVMYNIVNCYKSDLLLKKVTKNPTLIRFIIRGAPET